MNRWVSGILDGLCHFFQLVKCFRSENQRWFFSEAVHPLPLFFPSGGTPIKMRNSPFQLLSPRKGCRLCTATLQASPEPSPNSELRTAAPPVATRCTRSNGTGTPPIRPKDGVAAALAAEAKAGAVSLRGLATLRGWVWESSTILKRKDM